MIWFNLISWTYTSKNVYIYRSLLNSYLTRSSGNVGKKPWSAWSRSTVETLGRRPCGFEMFQMSAQMYSYSCIDIHIYIYTYNKYIYMVYLHIYIYIYTYKYNIYIYICAYSRHVFMILLFILFASYVWNSVTWVFFWRSQASRAAGKRRYTSGSAAKNWLFDGGAPPVIF